MKFVNYRKPKKPFKKQQFEKFNCLDCGKELQTIDGEIIQGCEHFQPKQDNSPYLKNTTEKPVEKLGGVRF